MATQTKIPPLTVSNPWWGHDPSDKQLEALWSYEECPNLFYGGAAGPGKTSYLLMAAVQYVQYPHYRALLLRKTYADLKPPGRLQGWSVTQVAEALERDSHTIGDWLSGFRRAGAQGLVFEHTGGSPPP